ncbi:hypothetical protein [Brachybacterium hainanense]|uniref:Acyl-CoA dehydrogenase n=1 Tax=Brachybacterium hainanense TaxID=1541174 RepID=A0ABV6RBE5_9MICO
MSPASDAAFPDLAPQIPRDLVPLPRAASLLLWASAYLRGDVGPDDAVEIGLGAGHRHRAGGGADLFDWMTQLRRLPLVSARLVLPQPGRIAGLIGPPSAISRALLAEQAVVVTAAGLAEHTLVPQTEVLGADAARGVEVTWTQIPGTGAQVPPPAYSAGAREELLRALRRAADSAAHLDLVPEEPIPQASLPPDWTAAGVPRHVPGPARHLLVLAARTLLLTRAELAEGSSAAGLSGELAREELLRDLADAAREALVDQVNLLAAAELG